MTEKDELCEKILYRTILELIEDLVIVPKEFLRKPHCSHSVGTRVGQLEKLLGMEDFRVEVHILSRTEKGYPLHFMMYEEGVRLLEVSMHSKQLRPSRVADTLTAAIFCGIDRQIRTRMKKFNILGEPPAWCDSNDIQLAYAPKLAQHRFPCSHCEWASLHPIQESSMDEEEDDVDEQTPDYRMTRPLF